MSFLGNVWNTVQAVAKPFVANVPLVGGFVASRIQMSPTPAQQATTDYLGPTANAVGYDVQQGVAAGNAVAAGRAPGITAQLGGGGMLIVGALVLLLLFVLLRDRRR